MSLVKKVCVGYTTSAPSVNFPLYDGRTLRRIAAKKAKKAQKRVSKK